MFKLVYLPTAAYVYIQHISRTRLELGRTRGEYSYKVEKFKYRKPLEIIIETYFFYTKKFSRRHKETGITEHIEIIVAAKELPANAKSMVLPKHFFEAVEVLDV